MYRAGCAIKHEPKTTRASTLGRKTWWDNVYDFLCVSAKTIASLTHNIAPHWPNGLPHLLATLPIFDAVFFIRLFFQSGKFTYFAFVGAASKSALANACTY